MIFLVLTGDPDIAKEDNHSFAHILPEDGVREVHKRGWGVCEAKWHHLELEVTIPGLECCFLYVFGGEGDLVVSTT